MTTSRLEHGQSAEIEVEVTVTVDLTTNPTGRTGAEVMSTLSLLLLMERCSTNASVTCPKDSRRSAAPLTD